MGGLGLSDFVHNAMQGVSSGQQQLANSMQMFAQMKAQKNATDAQRQNQLADQATARTNQLADQAHADAQHLGDQDLAAAEKGLYRVPGGQQAAAKRVVEAPGRIRDNPALSLLDSGLVGFGLPPGAITGMEVGAAGNDPRNQSTILAKAQGDLGQPGWDALRNTAWKGGADTWQMDPNFPRKAGKEVTLTPEMLDRYRLRAKAAVAGVPDPTQLEQAIAAATAAGNDTYATKLAQQRADVAAKAQTITDEQSARHLQMFIKQDIAAGVPEAPLLQAALDSGAFGPVAGGGAAKPLSPLEKTMLTPTGEGGEPTAPPMVPGEVAGPHGQAPVAMSEEAAITKRLAGPQKPAAAVQPSRQQYPSEYLTNDLLNALSKRGGPSQLPTPETGNYPGWADHLGPDPAVQWEPPQGSFASGIQPVVDMLAKMGRTAPGPSPALPTQLPTPQLSAPQASAPGLFSDPNRMPQMLGHGAEREIQPIIQWLKSMVGSAPAAASPMPPPQVQAQPLATNGTMSGLDQAAGAGPGGASQLMAGDQAARADVARTHPKLKSGAYTKFNIVNGQMVPKQPGEPGYDPHYRIGMNPYNW